MPKLVAIHQPNFFPWAGYFDKIARADIFVVLDDVQFPKTGAGVWSNRVKILQKGEARWLTAPIDRNYHGTRTISEMHFSDAKDWRRELLTTLTNIYKPAPHFDEAYALIAPLMVCEQNSIAAYNMHALRTLCDAFGLTTPLVPSSTLNVGETATERLIALTKAVEGDAYLCGGGAGGYQDDALFTQEGIALVYQDFVSEPYAQAGAESFVPGLSIIDMLMQTGVEATAQRIGGAS